MGDVTRPVLRWHGGKWLLAPWVLSYFPPHKVYVEPFAGAASVLMRKPRSYAEVINDLDDGVVNLFCVLRNPAQAEALQTRLRLTPFARAEFQAAYEVSPDPVEEAARLVIRSFMGFGSDGARRDKKTGFRSTSNRSGTTPSHDWANYGDALTPIVLRLCGVVVEQRDALACMAQHDSPQTLHYVDPPYHPATRQLSHRNNGYAHELSPDAHSRLLSELRRLSGMVVLSAYPHPLYDDALEGWHSVRRAAHADGAKLRTEVLWMNPLACQRLGACRDLFDASKPVLVHADPSARTADEATDG